MKILALFNFVDRAHVSERTLKAIRNVFEESGHEHRIVCFRSREESLEAIEKGPGEGFDTLLIGGGDGTVHHIYNLAWDKGYDCFGMIPLGTVNALARSLKLPLNPVKACRAMMKGMPHSLDVGRVGNTRFICFGSVGFDASVVHLIDGKAKIKYGRLAFFVCGMKRLFRLREIAKTRVTFPDGESALAESLIFSNIPNYAGFNFFNPGLDNGKIDLLIFKKNNILSYPFSVIKMFFQGHGEREDRYVLRKEITSFRIRAEGEGRVFLQLDGDPIPLDPEAETLVEILPQATRFLAPKV